MARRPPMDGWARWGFGIALTAFAFIVALGFSRMTLDRDPTSDSPLPSAVDCGSVFSPTDEPRCDEIRSDRNTLMLAIGVPGVALGLGIVVAARRMDTAR